MAGSFARRNTEFFLLDEMTSKYLASEMRGSERRKKRDMRKMEKEAVRKTKDKWRREEGLKRKFQKSLKTICKLDIKQKT